MYADNAHRFLKTKEREKKRVLGRLDSLVCVCYDAPGMNGDGSTDIVRFASCVYARVCAMMMMMITSSASASAFKAAS